MVDIKAVLLLQGEVRGSACVYPRESQPPVPGPACSTSGKTPLVLGMRVSVDVRQPLASEPHTGHNRWHPEIEPILTVAPGEVLTLETRDGADGQLTQESTHDDVLRLDFGRSHPLTGPVYVEGAGPGDVLEVEILDYEWGDSGVTPIIPGFGFLADLFPEPFLVKWALDRDVARSPEIPGVSIPAEAFAGVLGVAPSLELMREQLERERMLEERGFPVAETGASGAVPAFAAAGLRTIPPRENGGNLDIRHLVVGSRLFLPVHVSGALFSAGDLHFAQGDGEVCGSAIEIAGAVTVRFSVHQAPRPTDPASELRGSCPHNASELRDDRGLARRRWNRRVDGHQCRYETCSARVDRPSLGEAWPLARGGVRVDQRGGRSPSLSGRRRSAPTCLGRHPA